MLVELTGLERLLERVTLPLELPGVESARELVTASLHQLRDYLLPRYEQWDAPLIIVVGGSTGAGKSTLVNALVGEEVSEVSALRPTTRLPLLVHHPGDAHWFHTSKMLPRWIRQASSDARAHAPDEARIRLLASPHAPKGLALIDAPDIDSLDDTNRQRAAELLDLADAWIFATTAMRYADAVPWEYLRQARDRQAVLILVLGRTPVEHVKEIVTDLEGLLARHDLPGTPVFPVTEKSGGTLEMIAEEELAPIRAWLQQTIDPAARNDLVRQTAAGATRSLLERVRAISAAVRSQRIAEGTLAEAVESNFSIRTIEAALADGELLRGEVLKQWHEFLGTGEYFRRLEAGVSRLRDRISRLRRRPSEESLRERLGDGFTGLILGTCARAGQQTYTTWEDLDGGRELLSPGLAVPSADLAARTGEQVDQWQARVLDLVRTHGMTKRTGARIAALGVNAVGLLLMIVAFASTGGLVGAEVAIAGGTAVIAQRLLEAIFGEHGVRQLAAQAQEDLVERAAFLLDSEASRFTSRIPVIEDVDLDTACDNVRAALEESS